MHFHKFPYHANFEFVRNPGKPFATARGKYRLSVSAADNDVYRLTVSGPGWERNDSLTTLNFIPAKNPASATTRLTLGKTVTLSGRDGRAILQAPGHLFLGQCGEASLFQFQRPAGAQFYGLGEKWTGLEHSNKITKFWNTDAFADFDHRVIRDGHPDPMYVSIPYLIVKQGNTYTGLLLHNPRATFIATGLQINIAGQKDLGTMSHAIALGAERGQPSLYIIHGPTLGELTRKMQQLTGATPLPPLWSLGYQQCRWGYQSAADLRKLDAQFRRHRIPADGLWLDIEYMDRYKVFTFDAKNFPNPKQDLAKLAAADRRVVPIIDPGVKLERGYPVYERGKKADAFCRNPQGRHYVGLVWPGETVFPDFSLPAARAWWAAEVQRFAASGITAAWLDMNDPSTGLVDNQDMLFDRGNKTHDTFHNQYALGMAAATRAGFLAARPAERPFLLTRSGCVGTQRHAAIWTGDNCSNYHHLRNSIATTLNLALSGVPFNGADIGGFDGDTSAPLLLDWFKAAFLFPFCRNHCSFGKREQEPWAFGAEPLAVIRRHIQLRYRLRPYLYQLFAQHELTGDAVIRPLFYDFPDTPALPLGNIADQFMVGPHLMQAPFVDEGAKRRDVVLPAGDWFNLSAGKWQAGGVTDSVRARAQHTPWYARDGAIIPCARQQPHEHRADLSRADFHIFLRNDGTARARYIFDDGLSFDYQRGVRSEVELTAERRGAALNLHLHTLADGHGAGDFTFTTLGDVKTVRINNRPAQPAPAQGIPLGAYRVRAWC